VKALGVKGPEGFGVLPAVVFLLVCPQPIMRHIAKSLRCAAATFEGFER
jgi:hypothetical protein